MGKITARKHQGWGIVLRAARLSGVEGGGFWLNWLSRIPAGLGCAGLRRGPRKKRPSWEDAPGAAWSWCRRGLCMPLDGAETRRRNMGVLRAPKSTSLSSGCHAPGEAGEGIAAAWGVKILGITWGAEMALQAPWPQPWRAAEVTLWPSSPTVPLPLAFDEKTGSQGGSDWKGGPEMSASVSGDGTFNKIENKLFLQFKFLFNDLLFVYWLIDFLIKK